MLRNHKLRGLGLKVPEFNVSRVGMDCVFALRKAGWFKESEAIFAQTIIVVATIETLHFIYYMGVSENRGP